MKTNAIHLVSILGLSAIAAPAFALTATFDGLNPYSSVASGYQESGIQFTSPNGFNVVSGSFAGTLFGGSPYYAGGNALSVSNQGWVGISAPGTLMASVSLTYGFDWNFYAIEYGLMDVNVEWLAMFDGNIVATGGLNFDRDNRSHGGGTLTATSATPFDQLLVRSTAVGYQAVPWSGPNPNGWFYDRGAVLGYGDANHLAFDSVNVTTSEPSANNLGGASAIAVPDDADGTPLLIIAVLGTLLAVRLHRQSGTPTSDEKA